jgi:hypothetical protein
MVRHDYIARGSSDSSKRITRPRRAVTNASRDETPCRFDGTEIVPIRQQALHGSAALLDEEANLRSLVGLQIVQQYNVPSAETRGEPTLHPDDKGNRIHRPPLCAQDDPCPSPILRQEENR